TGKAEERCDKSELARSRLSDSGSRALPLGYETIHFIAEKSGERKYIQVAYLLPGNAVIEREFGNLELISDNYEKLVVSMDDVNLGNRDRIRHINAWNFCSKLK
ncbi:MAG: hypothetical protein DRP49_09215, partial [Spirochaetes bacterium]